MDEIKDTRNPPPAWIDKDFIQTALRAGENDPNITVLSFDIKFAHAVGDGYGSDMYRVSAKLSDSQQRSVIVKSAVQGGVIEDVMKSFNAFERETKMLNEVLPAMHDMLEAARPSKYIPFGAKCLYHGKDPVEFLVMEDLRQSGFTLAKRQEGIDIDHSTLAIKTLARFHAASLALYDRDPSTITFFNKSHFCEELREQMSGLFVGVVKNLEEQTLKWPGCEKYSEKLKLVREDIFDRVIEVCTRKEDDFNTLIHGDTWTTNMMFKYTNGIVSDFRLVDFQTCIYSSPANDLQYFLNACPNDNVRRFHIDHLIEEYHNNFMETLNDLGCNHHEISLSDLKKAYKEHAFFGFLSTACILPIVISKPSDGLDIEEILKNQSEISEVNRKVYLNEEYLNTIKRRLPEFEQDGVFKQ